MLEDLAHGITKPCILDLKMGLKQRSIRNYSYEKIRSKESKSKSTTSHLLGFRLCGAQLCPSGDEPIVFYNKYFGRLQDARGTFDILRSFFDSINDCILRKRTIALFVSQLQELRRIIESLPGFRFWSGSLLFIFDSAMAAEDVERSVVVKMIDFANYTRLVNNEQFDKEYVYGIDILIRFLNGIIDDAPVDTLLGELPTSPSPNVQDQELVAAVEAFRSVHPSSPSES
jgi:hypothetical protein